MVLTYSIFRKNKHRCDAAALTRNFCLDPFLAFFIDISSFIRKQKHTQFKSLIITQVRNIYRFKSFHIFFFCLNYNAFNSMISLVVIRTLYTFWLSGLQLENYNIYNKQTLKFRYGLNIKVKLQGFEKAIMKIIKEEKLITFPNSARDQQTLPQGFQLSCPTRTFEELRKFWRKLEQSRLPFENFR